MDQVYHYPPELLELLVDGIPRLCRSKSRPAINTCTEPLQHKVVTLCLLERLIEVLEQHGDLRRFLKVKVQPAVIDKKPFVRLRQASGTPGAVSSV